LKREKGMILKSKEERQVLQHLTTRVTLAQLCIESDYALVNCQLN